MKKIILSSLAIAALFSVSASAFDPSSMTSEERDAFRADMQSKMSTMSSDERDAFRADMRSQMQGSGGQGSGPQDGTGHQYRGQH
jgi:hypothetical protein